MSVAMPLPKKITINSNPSTKHRTLEARFGDGYGQFAPDGLNSKVRFWDIEWGPLTLSEKQTVETALDTVGGFGTLLWTPCNEVTQLKWRVVGGEYSSPAIANGMYKITCKLEQRFD